MYIRTYVCMYVCRYVCTYIRTYVCMYVHTYVCMCTCTYVCTVLSPSTMYCVSMLCTHVCACNQQCVLVQFVCVSLYNIIHSYKLSLSFMCLSCDYHCLSSVARRLFNEECPLEILVDSAAEDRFSKLVLRDNVDGSIQVCFCW